MVALKTLGLAALAVGALAGPVATSEKSKPFKIGVTFANKETLYLTKTTTASASAADAIECTITTTTTGGKSVGKLGCGPDNKAFTYSEFHTLTPLQPVVSDKKNVAWSIGADNVINWGAMPAGSKAVTFSRQKAGNQKNIYAEVCTTYDHHKNLGPVKDFWQRGVAKAYFV
jgi:hypothetical protein